MPSRSRRIVMPTRETFDSSKRTSTDLRARSAPRQQLERRRLPRVARERGRRRAVDLGPRAVAEVAQEAAQQRVVGEVRLRPAELVERPGAGVAGAHVEPRLSVAGAEQAPAPARCR